MLWDYRFDCIAFNSLADELYEWTASPESFERNIIWRSFMDPKRTTLNSEVEHFLHNAVGMLRLRYALHLGEPYFESLVNSLLATNERFRKLWTEHHTASTVSAPLVLTHYRLGVLALRSIGATFPAIPESTLVFVCASDDATTAVLEGLLKH